MSHPTTFAGLLAPDPGDTINVSNGDFIYKNPDLIDQFLRIGAISHRHDAHAPIADPNVAMTGLAIASAGTLPGSADFYVTYSLVDQYGGETKAAPSVHIQTGTQIAAPAQAPAASADYSAGIMPAGTYFYAQTFTDGVGGETNLGQYATVYVSPGYASARVGLSGLRTGMPTNGTWRLWRSYEGADWHLVREDNTDTFIDAGFDPPDNPARPPELNVTAQTNTLAVTMPTTGAVPQIAQSSHIRIYISEDNGFADPSLLATLPIACAGSTFLITSDTVTTGSPPYVSRSIPGAHQIDPDTELLNWTWLRPVSTFGALGSAAYGCVRVTLDTGQMWEVRNPLGAAGPADWSPAFGAGTTVFIDGGGPYDDIDFIAGSGVSLSVIASGGSAEVRIDVTDIDLSTSFEASGGTGSATVTSLLEFVGSGAASAKVTDLGGGSALVTITVPTVAGPTGATGATGAAGATGATGAAGSSAVFTASAGTASAIVGPFLGIVGSGAASAQLSTVNGSAIVTITVPQPLKGDTGATGATGATGGTGATGATGAAGTNAPTLTVEDGTTSVIPTKEIKFIGATVADLGGGSARVTISAGGGGGGSTIAVEGPGGSPQITPVSDIRFIASGNASAGVINLGGGSAEISISVTPTPCFPVDDNTGGSAQAGGMNARPIEFVGSGAASAAVTSSGGSAVVTITVPQPLQGATGATGATGAAGATGAKGDKGDTGAAGGGGGAGGIYITASGFTVGSAGTIVASGSGAMRTSTSSLGGGSAQVLIGMPTQGTDVFTTPVLASGASATNGASAAMAWAIARTGLLLQVQTDVPVRLRLYGSPTKQAQDAGRAIGVDPGANIGLLLELVTSSNVNVPGTASGSVYDLSPPVILANTEGASAVGVSPTGRVIYASVQNLSNVNGQCTVHLIKYPLET